jgi:hypothetical protein
MKKNLLFLTIFLTLVSCSQRDTDEILPGETTLSEAIDVLGDPISVRRSSFNHNEEIYEFEESSLQVEKKLVKALFRSPEEEEFSLQFWRQEFKDRVSTISPVRAPSGLGLWELKYPSQGLAVIYNSNTSKVLRIIRYEAKK